MADNSFTKTYADGDALLADDLDTGFESVQPALANLAYSTTGSSANEILASTGSNLAPDYISPNAFALTISASGANAIIGVLSSVVSSTANLIINAGSSAAVPTALFANTIINAASSAAVPTALFANTIVTAANSLSVPTVGLSNNIVNNFTRPTTSSAVGLRGIAVSDTSGTFASTSTSFTDVTNLSVTLTTSGRPVHLSLQPDGTGSNSGIGFELASSADGGAIDIQFLRGTTSVAVHHMGTRANGSSSDYGLEAWLPSVVDIGAMTAGAGTYVYKVQVSTSATLFATALTSNTTSARVFRVKLVAFEL